jgi:hypothetical protein
VPQGSSMTWLLNQQTGLSRNGLRQDIVFMTLLSLSTNITSMLNRIKKVWIELHGLINSASPVLRLLRASKPIILLKGVRAIVALSAKIVPLVLLTIFIRQD